MPALFGTATIRIHPGQLDEFKRLAARCLELVRTKDTGTIEYEMFINEAQTEVMVHERYRDSAAGLQHGANQSAELLEALRQVCSISGEVCGSPSPELRQKLLDGGVKLYAPFDPTR